MKKKIVKYNVDEEEINKKKKKHSLEVEMRAFFKYCKNSNKSLKSHQTTFPLRHHYHLHELTDSDY